MSQALLRVLIVLLISIAAVAPSRGSWDEARALFEEALAYREGGWLRDAQAALSEAVATEPAYTEAWLELGSILLELQDYQAAQRAYENAATGAHEAAAYRGLGLAALKLGRNPEARNAFEQALRADSLSISNQVLLGLAFFLGEDAGRADAAWRRAHELDPAGSIDEFREGLGQLPGPGGAGKGRGARQREAQRFVDAIWAFKAALDLWVREGRDPGSSLEEISRDTDYERDAALGKLLGLEAALTSYISSLLTGARGRLNQPAALNIQGIALHELGLYEEALRTYENAFKECGDWGEVDPSCIDILVNRGRALAALGRNEAAIESYRRAIHKNPDSMEAFFNLGNALGRLHRDEEAIEAYQWAVEIFPGHAETRFNLANVFAALGRRQEAESAYLMAVTLKPDYAEAHNNLGVLHEESGRWSEALEVYQRSLRINPRSIDAHYNLAGVLARLSRDEEALATLSRVAGFDPDSSRAFVDRGAILSRLSRHEEALFEYRRAIAIDSLSAAAHFNLGLSLKALERWEESARALARAARLSPDDAMIFFERGVVLKRSGLLDEARRDLEESLRLDPAHVLTLYHLSGICRSLGEEERARDLGDRLRALDPEKASALMEEPTSRE